MIRIFDANRRRASAFASRRRVAGMLRVLSLLTLLAWLLIWALANEAQRNALSQAVQDYWQQNFGASSTDDQGAH